MKGFFDGEPADLNPADIISLVLIFGSLALLFAGGESGITALTILAAVVSVPGGVLKVMSTRAKSRRWTRARQREKEKTGGPA